MKDIDGRPVELSQYQGKVVLLVNVASKCGYTPQYRGLEKLYEKYSKDGLVVIGVPANEFGGQEPGSNKEISTFCVNQYAIDFPMFAKTALKTNPLYADLIKAINGLDMSTPDKALEAYTKLKTASHLSVRLERRGEDLTLDYQIR